MEQPKIFSTAALKKIEETRRRVEKLSKTDSPYQDSVYDLGKHENDIRDSMKNDGLNQELVEKYGDKFSTIEMEKMEAEKENWIDDLTDLKNREALLGEIPGILGMEKRKESHATVLMIDMDHFKDVNDTYGHYAGDQALRLLADILRNSVRKSDFVYRYGGEEFVIVLPDTPSTAAAEISDKIRSNVENFKMVVLDDNDNQHTLHKTISIGYIGTDQLEEWKNINGDEFEDILEKLLQRSDLALYYSKEHGRNKVTLYDESVKIKE